MPTPYRVLTASFKHEANTFASRNASLADFERPGLFRGAEALAQTAGTNEELAGFQSVAARAGIELLPIFRAHCQPLGYVQRDAYETLKAELLAGVRAAGPLDGVLLSLHGAMAAEHVDDADGDLLTSVREIVGPDVPIVSSHDLHANITSAMAGAATALVGFHTVPHVDVAETGARAAALLAQVLRGEARPALAWRKIPMISPAEKHRSSVGTFGELFALLAAIERRPGVLSASLFPVQPWLDVPELGWSAVVVTDADAALADRCAAELAEASWARRHELLVELTPLGEAVARAIRAPRGPIVFADAADSTNSGATGDSTAVLAALIGPAAGGAVGGPVLLHVVDAAAARAAAAAGPGATVTLDVGGTLDLARFRPVRVTATVERISDGRYAIESEMLQGQPANVGTAVVLAAGELRLVVCEASPPGHDPGIYRHLGLEPASAKIVQVKSPSGFRAWYEPIAAEIVLLDTPGAATGNLAGLRFQKAPRPLFPIDR